MDKELDVLIKGITSKYYTEYLKAIYKPNENARLPKAIKNSDAYKQIKENLIQLVKKISDQSLELIIKTVYVL